MIHRLARLLRTHPRACGFALAVAGLLLALVAAAYLAGARSGALTAAAWVVGTGGLALVAAGLGELVWE